MIDPRSATGALLLLGAMLASCGTQQTAEESQPSVAESPVPGSRAFRYRAVEDNVRHDTLLIQTTFDLGDGSFVMVASHRDEKFEGLRLYRYRPKADSSAEMIAISSPAYDSWTMLPSFFGSDSTRTSDLRVLANFGERESWGQKLLKLDGAGFHDLGFIDAALPERTVEDGVHVLKRRNIAERARVEIAGDSTWIRFACDSVFLYDDQRGSYDLVLPAAKLKYLSAPEGLSLWINEEKREVKQPT